MIDALEFVKYSEKAEPPKLTELMKRIHSGISITVTAARLSSLVVSLTSILKTKPEAHGTTPLN